MYYNSKQFAPYPQFNQHIIFSDNIYIYIYIYTYYTNSLNKALIDLTDPTKTHAVLGDIYIYKNIYIYIYIYIYILIIITIIIIIIIIKTHVVLAAVPHRIAHPERGWMEGWELGVGVGIGCTVNFHTKNCQTKNL